MPAFPPPTLPRPAAPEPQRDGFWGRRSRPGQAGIVGVGVLVALMAIGAVLPDPETADSARASGSTESSVVTDAPAAPETPVTVATSTPTLGTPAPTDVPVVAEGPAPSAPDTTPVPPALTVSRIVDGDTVEMSDGSTVRLIGIDTPEHGDCGDEEAATTLGMLVYGQSVTLTPGARDDVDQYGRLLRYLDLGNGTDANLAMIRAGQAVARYDSRDGYGPHSREDTYVAADGGATPLCAPVTVAPIPAPQPAVAVPPPAAAPAPTNVSYQNCDAVRAAGAAPIRPGDPGFEQKFDKDNDGIGCE